MTYDRRGLTRGLVVTCLLLAFFVPLSLGRFVAADESYYLVAAKQVLGGAAPYRDFFYPQMPVLPYLFAGWHAVVGSHWVTARILAALLAAWIGMLLFERLHGTTSRRWAACGVLLFVLSNLVIVSYTTAKTVAASVLLLMGAYTALVGVRADSPRAGPRRLTICGLLLGLATGVSVFVSFAVAGVLLHVVASSEQRLRAAGIFGAGVVLGLVPTWIFLVFETDRFLFDNFLYHLSRYEWEGLDAPWAQKTRTALMLVGLRENPHISPVQFAPLVGLTGGYGLLCWRSKRAPDPALWIAICLLAAAFVPTPAHARYFAATVPFLVICSCRLVADVRVSTPWRRRSLAALGGLFLTVYAWEGGRDVQRVTIHGTAMHNVFPTRLDAARIATMAEVARRIDRLAEPGEYVLSPWPGFLFGSEARVYPRLENQFWRRLRLSPEERRRYHLMSKEELRETMESGRVPVAVLERRRKHDDGKVLEASGYELVDELHGIRIYERR